MTASHVIALYVLKDIDGTFLAHIDWLGRPVWTSDIRQAKLYRGGHGLDPARSDKLKANRGRCAHPSHHACFVRFNAHEAL